MRAVFCMPGVPEPIDAGARRQMAVFDELGPRARAAFRDARNDFDVPDLARHLRIHGVHHDVATALRRRDLTPSEVDFDELLAMEVERYDAELTGEREREIGRAIRAPIRASNGRRS